MIKCQVKFCNEHVSRYFNFGSSAGQAGFCEEHFLEMRDQFRRMEQPVEQQDRPVHRDSSGEQLGLL